MSFALNSFKCGSTMYFSRSWELFVLWPDQNCQKSQKVQFQTKSLHVPLSLWVSFLSSNFSNAVAAHCLLHRSTRVIRIWDTISHIQQVAQAQISNRCGIVTGTPPLEGLAQYLLHLVSRPATWDGDRVWSTDSSLLIYISDIQRHAFTSFVFVR